MIRKSGWLIAIVMLALVLALVYLFAGFAIRIGLVYTLERAVGAEVNIDDVSMRLAPLALDIDGLQITDKDQPTHNLLSFERAEGALAVWPALLGYRVIDNLSVDGLAFGGERARPGKVYRGENADSEQTEGPSLTEVLKLDFPNAEELLARADLKTPALGKRLLEQAREQKAELQALPQQLPTKARLDALEAQIKALTDSKIQSPQDLADKARQLDEVQREVRAERDKLRGVKTQLGDSRDRLQAAVAEVKAASAADLQRVRQLANLDGGGIAPISQLLLGDVWGERIGQLEGFYRMVAPYLPDDEGGGEDPVVEEVRELPTRILPLPTQPYPDLWIKNARINWQVAGGSATISARDITAQHAIIDAPTRFSVDAERLPRLASLALSGDFRVLEELVTHLNWRLQGYQLQDLPIGRGDVSLTLQRALMDFSGDLDLTGTTLRQQGDVQLGEPQFTSGANEYATRLASLLNDQDSLPLSLGATGPLGSPDIRVRSNLDQLIGDALLGEAKARAAELEADVRSRLDARLQDQLGNQAQWVSELDVQEGLVSTLETRIENLLKAKLANATDSVKEKAKDKLKGKLLDKIGG